MSDSSINVRATLVATNEMSPAIRRVIADIEKLKAAARNFSASFSNVGRAGMASMDGFDRTIKATAAQMRGLSNVSKSSARNYAADWDRATTKRLSDARRMYQSLEKMEAGYQRQLEHRMAAERRASRASASSSRGTGRLPAPSIRSMAIGAGVAGAGIGSAIKKRIEVQAAEVRSMMFGDLTKGEVESLRKDFADKAGIKYGVGTTKVLDVAVEGLKAGIGKQFAGEFADLALKAQAGLDVDTQGVGKLLGRLSTQMPWNKDRFSKILNSIAVSNNATAADGSEIIEAMRRSLSALATTKMTPEQLAALDATGISLGVQPFKMGTFVSFLTSQVAGADSAHGQQAKDLASAANALGFGGRGAMAKAMRDRPMEAITQILDGLAKMPEALRTKVAKQIGGREWMDELLTLVLGRGKLKDVLRDIESKPGFLDKTALQKIRSMQGRWASIVAAFGLVWEKVGAGFEKWFDQISDSLIGLADSFNFDTIKQHVDALVDGLREGFGLKDWGEAITSLARNFGAGTIAKWRDFGKGFAEGIKEFAGSIKTAFNVVSFIGGASDGEGLGKFIGKLAGLTLAVSLLSPMLNALSIFSATIVMLATANPFARLAMGFVALAVGLKKVLEFVSDKIFSVFVSVVDSIKNLALSIINKVRGWIGLDPVGSTDSKSGLKKPSSYTDATDFSGRRRSTARDLADNLKQFTGKVERAAFINGGNGVTKAFHSGGSGGMMIAGGGGGGARSFIGGVPGLLTNKPGTSLPSSILGSGGIIRRDRIPSFNGGGGSVASPGPAPSLDPKIGAGLSGNSYLAARRARFGEDMKSNPALREQVAAMMVLEGAKDPLPVVESLMNRMDMTGGSLMKGLGIGNPKSFYGPIRRGQLPGAIARLRRDPKLRAKMDTAIDAALAGSNEIKGATDQGLPTDPNGRWLGGRIYRGGNIFNDWGGGKWQGKTGHAASQAYREDLMRHVQGAASAPTASQVPTAADAIQNVPAPGAIRGDASLGLQRGGGGPVNIHINGSSHDPESLATLVQRRIDESMNWRTHDSVSEYT